MYDIYMFHFSLYSTFLSLHISDFFKILLIGSLDHYRAEKTWRIEASDNLHLLKVAKPAKLPLDISTSPDI